MLENPVRTMHLEWLRLATLVKPLSACMAGIRASVSLRMSSFKKMAGLSEPAEAGPLPNSQHSQREPGRAGRVKAEQGGVRSKVRSIFALRFQFFSQLRELLCVQRGFRDSMAHNLISTYAYSTSYYHHTQCLSRSSSPPTRTARQ